jgi:dCMP deaminase
MKIRSGKMDRRDKTNYYLDIAEQASKRCTCLRRHYGAVIVKDDEVIATGYAGAPRGRKNCSDLGFCVREEKKIARGERYELCRSVHAEANAIISAARKDMMGASMYIVGFEAATGNYVENANSCAMCKRLVINAGIESVYVRDDETNYRIISVADWVENDDSLNGTIGY